MNRWQNAVWWLCFIALAICVQALAPGVDVLLVGLVILLQEEDWWGLLWLLPLFVLLQEGMGTRPFGSIIVWYAASVALFKLGKWFFDARNFMFIFMLSACLGAVCFLLEWLMAPLQNLPFNIEDALDKSIVQAIFMPFAWRMLTFFRLQPKEEEEE